MDLKLDNMLVDMLRCMQYESRRLFMNDVSRSRVIGRMLFNILIIGLSILFAIYVIVNHFGVILGVFLGVVFAVIFIKKLLM